MGTTEAITSFLSATRTEDIPGEVLALAKRGVIDTLGVAIGAASHPVADILTKTFPPAAAGEAFLWNGRGKTSVLDAALSNGTLAHTLDFDDGGVALTPMHPSSPVLAAVWALGESRGLAGREILAAYALGVEVECKLASAVSLTHYDHGWHTTAVIGSFGAAAGAGWLLGLNAEQSRTALGIAASMTGGLRANFGTMTKPLHAGLAARNGLMAARLAQEGWSANQNILETKKGFFEVFECGEVGELNLGKPFHFQSPGVSIKRFPSCSATHHCIEAMIALRRDHVLRAEQIDKVECRVHAVSYQALRKEPVVATAEQGRFSLHFTTALVLLEGSVELKHFTPETFGRKDIQELMGKVTVAVHPELETLESKKKAFGQVDVRLKDGRLLSHRATQVRGRAPLALTDDDVDAKFIGCAEPALGELKAQELLAALRRLESQKKIQTLLPRAFTLAS
jgi:2-methylcitrate dehydratase PrpD